MVGPNKSHGKTYQAIDEGFFKTCFAHLTEDWSEFTFVDLGCGKGRALLLARELGFRRIIGVEFAPSLAKTARRNCSFAEIEIGDAAQYAFPSGPLVVFMYNPFDENVMCQVIQHLPSCYVAYMNPLYDGLFESVDQPIFRSKEFSIWLRKI